MPNPAANKHTAEAFTEADALLGTQAGRTKSFSHAAVMRAAEDRMPLKLLHLTKEELDNLPAADSPRLVYVPDPIRLYLVPTGKTGWNADLLLRERDVRQLTRSQITENSVTRLLLTAEEAENSVVIEADTGITYMLRTGADPTVKSSWLRVGDRAVNWESIYGRPEFGTLALQDGKFSGDSSGTNTGDQDLSGLVPKLRKINGQKLDKDIVLTPAAIKAATAEQGELAANAVQPHTIPGTGKFYNVGELQDDVNLDPKASATIRGKVVADVSITLLPGYDGQHLQVQLRAVKSARRVEFKNASISVYCPPLLPTIAAHITTVFNFAHVDDAWRLTSVF